MSGLRSTYNRIEPELGLGLPVMTTAERTAYVPTLDGTMVWDDTIGEVFIWESSAWENMNNGNLDADGMEVMLVDGTTPNSGSGVVTFATLGIAIPTGKTLFSYEFVSLRTNGRYLDSRFGDDTDANSLNVLVDLNSGGQLEFFDIGTNVRNIPFRLIIRWE